MYGLLDCVFSDEEHEKSNNCLKAYNYWVENGASVSYIKNVLAKGDSSFAEDTVDEFKEMLMSADYDDDKAVNAVVGCKKSIGGYIKDCMIYASRRVRDRRKKERTVSYFNKLKEDSELDYENELTDSNIEIELIKVEDSTMNATAAVKSLMSSVNDSMLLEIMFYFERVDKKTGTCMLKSAGYAESDRSVISRSEIHEVLRQLASLNRNDIIAAFEDAVYGGRQIMKAYCELTEKKCKQ